ncbi:hypothetical protein SAMN02745121_05696 [Nannocystis exedens]|uniref:Uncharacterized protein n=1 Tax=Nannocystis exedens TaxID=54 RepID=A0A1I2DR15_9BACT|nr:hypothetical protein [Nannocystis exedens]PCC68971.1 hypothetical protein NAEX_01993 [Nannocystis exedens]SFE82927.1 hypothetical protein SAMN02745121_05696 [Nannocystis exedens]
MLEAESLRVDGLVVELDVAFAIRAGCDTRPALVRGPRQRLTVAPRDSTGTPRKQRA